MTASGVPRCHGNSLELRTIAGLLNEDIANKVSLNQQPVRRWRTRRQKTFDGMIRNDAAAEPPPSVR